MSELMKEHELWLHGKTNRLHTNPGIRNENVAEHTFGVLVWIMYYFPDDTSSTLMRAAVCHDMHEHICGDIPSNILSKLGVEARQKLETESKVTVSMYMPKSYVDEDSLDKRERDILLICDKYDFLMYCYNEWRIGNRNLNSLLVRSVVLVTEVAAKYPEDEGFMRMRISATAISREVSNAS